MKFFIECDENDNHKAKLLKYLFEEFLNDVCNTEISVKLRNKQNDQIPHTMD